MDEFTAANKHSLLGKVKNMIAGQADRYINGIKTINHAEAAIHEQEKQVEANKELTLELCNKLQHTTDHLNDKINSQNIMLR